VMGRFREGAAELLSPPTCRARPRHRPPLARHQLRRPPRPSPTSIASGAGRAGREGVAITLAEPASVRSSVTSRSSPAAASTSDGADRRRPAGPAAGSDTGLREGGRRPAARRSFREVVQSPGPGVRRARRGRGGGEARSRSGHADGGATRDVTGRPRARRRSRPGRAVRAHLSLHRQAAGVQAATWWRDHRRSEAGRRRDRGGRDRGAVIRWSRYGRTAPTRSCAP
jgi:hypothetical protein